jgi:hypothetical protein
MAGRSLWSILMVAWLSAGNASVPAHDAAAPGTAITEQEREGDGQPLLDIARADDTGATSDPAADAP